jgi:tetratricopeptide (TPR) repeat protein
MNRYRNNRNNDRKKKLGNKKSDAYIRMTFSELMEEAIEQEEKGERYGDGKKARNFYENACNLYEKAHNKEKQDFTCLYNWARVTYILATFSKPAYSTQKIINLLQLAIERFRSALNLNPKALDAMFNLKQALSSFGEICLDEVSEQAALPFFKEACDLGDQVFKLQEETYRNAQQNHHDELEHEHDDEPTTSNTTNTTNDEDIYIEEVDTITINSLIETLTTNAEDLNNLSTIIEDNAESEKLYNEALEKLKRAEELVKEAEQKSKSKKENNNENDNNNNDDDDDEIVLNSIDSTYATILSSRGEHLFNTLGIFDAMFFESALDHQNKVIQRIPESSNSQVVYQQKAQELCNKADILCSFAETLMNNGESIDEHSPSQEMYREALAAYEKALTFEDSNNSIICKIGDMKLTLAHNYLLLSENKEDDAYQSMLQLIRQGLDIYKVALKNNVEQPVEPEIYLRIAKGLSYYDDLTKQCQGMLQKFVQMGGSLEMMEDDRQFVNFDFCDDIKNKSWFIQGMKQLE